MPGFRLHGNRRSAVHPDTASGGEKVNWWLESKRTLTPMSLMPAGSGWSSIRAGSVPAARKKAAIVRVAACFVFIQSFLPGLVQILPGRPHSVRKPASQSTREHSTAMHDPPCQQKSGETSGLGPGTALLQSVRRMKRTPIVKQTRPVRVRMPHGSSISERENPRQMAPSNATMLHRMGLT